MDDDPSVLPTLILTEQERRVAARALNMCAVMLDAIDDALGAATALELAGRICPEEDRV